MSLNGSGSGYMPSSPRLMYSPRMAPRTVAQPYLQRSPHSGNDITIIRERPKTIIREVTP